MGVKKIDHIGIAVKDIQSVLGFYQEALGLENLGFEVVEDQGVRVAFLPVGESTFELLEPLNEESPVAKFIARRGEGIGRQLVRRLMAVDNPDHITWVLRAGRGSPGFWEKMGFRKSDVAMEVVRKG